MLAPSLSALALSLILSLAPFGPGTSTSRSSDGYTEGLAQLDKRFRDSLFTAVEDSLLRWETEVGNYAALSLEERRVLQQAPYHEHVTASRRVGVRPGRSSYLTPVSADNPYYSVGWDGLLAEEAIATLDLIGARFQQECRSAHLPAARFVVTSTFRSADRQAELRETNGNATKGQSSHEFGGSFDIGYNRFLPIGEGAAAGFYQIDGGIPPRLLASLQYAVAVREEGFAAGIVARNPQAYAAVMGRTLVALQKEGRLLALQEFLQPCFHVTAMGGLAKA